MTTATVHVEQSGPDRVVLRLTGEIDMENAQVVEAELSRAVSNRAVSVTLDCRELGYLDSAGLRILFTFADRLALLQIGLDMLVPPRSPIRRAIELSGLDTVVEVRS